VLPDPPAADRASLRESSSKKSGLAIAGKVVDDLGAPVPGFVLEVRQPGGEGDSAFPNVIGIDEETRSMMKKLLQERGERPASEDTDPLVRTFDAQDGSFRMEGLATGQWQISASEGDARQSAPVVIDPSEAASDIVLVLPRSAAL